MHPHSIPRPNLSLRNVVQFHCLLEVASARVTIPQHIEVVQLYPIAQLIQGNALQIEPVCALGGDEIGRPGNRGVIPAVRLNSGVVSIQPLSNAPTALYSQIGITQALPAAD